MMADTIVLGGAALWQLDAIQDVASSSEASMLCDVETKPYAVLDEHGEAILRRVRIIGRVRSPFTLQIVPVVDGRRRTGSQQGVAVTTPAPGTWRRFEVLVPIFTQDSGSTLVRGMRGSEFGLYLYTNDPSTEFFIDAATIELRPLGTRRRREA